MLAEQNSSTPKPRPFMRATAERCSHCKRELPSGLGTDIPGIGVVGPECLRHYASLAPVLAQVQGLEAHEDDQGSMRLAWYVNRDLRNLGLAVQVVDVKPGVKALRVVGMVKKPRDIVQTWEQMRAQFELRLKLAALERGEEVAA